MPLRTIPIRRVGNRENLFLGGDREIVMTGGLLAFTLVFATQDTLAAVFGIALWVAILYLARLMAKKDPKLRHVYLRHRKYRTYYPARSTPFRENGPIQASRYR